jgi:hypothetical protein
MTIHETVGRALTQLTAARTMEDFQAAMALIHTVTPADLDATERSILLSLLDDLQPALEHFAAREREDVFFRNAVSQAFVNWLERGLGIQPPTVQ